MTFIEAAIAILKREGRPLHFKKLTEIALKENLLTVVGRTPEATMQQRLNDAMKKDTSTPLTREKPGVFGLRWYPKKGEEEEETDTAAATAAATATVTATAAATETEGATQGNGEEKKRRRRRGGRGRRKREGAEAPTAAAEAQEEAAPAAEVVDEAEERAEAAQAVERAAEEERPRVEPERRSFAEAAAVVAAGRKPEEAPEVVAAPPAVEEAAEPEPMPEEERAEAPPADEAIEEALDEEELAAELEEPSGPLIAPTHGTEELVKGEDHRPVYEGPSHRRRDRHERREERRREREARAQGRREAREARQQPGPQQKQAQPQPSQQQQSQPQPSQPQPSQQAPSQPPPQQQGAAPAGSPLDAAVEVLRGSDGRPMHFRQIIDQAVKRKLLRGDAPELWRMLRAAVLVEARAREAAGLRPRVRAVGGGNYALGDRRLDGELAQYERELGERAARLSEATRAALHRRLGRLAPAAFETLGRLLLERMGLASVELVKRGEGVAYFGAVRPRGRKAKVLVGMRPGEGELQRRAVGELRAGLKARSYDEGILLAGGRAGGEALAELSAGAGPVDLYDGEALAALCVRLGVGVMKRLVPVDTLDIELFGELSEG